jgi:hypothetical protein
MKINDKDDFKEGLTLMSFCLGLLWLLDAVLYLTTAGFPSYFMVAGSGMIGSLFIVEAFARKVIS